MKNFLLFLVLTSINTYATDLLEFSDDLIVQGDLFRALTVLKEAEFTSRGTSKGFVFQKKILQLHLESKDFDGFDFQVDQTFKNYGPFIKNYNFEEIKAETYFILGNYSKAFEDLYAIDTNLEKKYLFRAYSESTKALQNCETATCVDIKNIEQNMTSAKFKKNEYFALGIGIIPGMGQVYAGNTGSGIATFILNSFFIATSIIAFNNNEPAMGFATSVVGATFYLSSIYAGYETARRYNSSIFLNEKKKLSDIPVKLNLMNIIFN
jgi:TM2 domain-containing membrane protein YozV